MAISTLDASLLALEDPYYSCPRRSPSKKIGPWLTREHPTRYLLLHELDGYEDEVESIRALALVREMPARCKKPD